MQRFGPGISLQQSVHCPRFIACVSARRLLNGLRLRSFRRGGSLGLLELGIDGVSDLR